GDLRERAAGYHEGFAVDRLVHLCGFLPGNDPRADRSRDHGQEGWPARSEGKRDRWSPDPGRYRSGLPPGPQGEGSVGSRRAYRVAAVGEGGTCSRNGSAVCRYFEPAGQRYRRSVKRRCSLKTAPGMSGAVFICQFGNCACFAGGGFLRCLVRNRNELSAVRRGFRVDGAGFEGYTREFSILSSVLA